MAKGVKKTDAKELKSDQQKQKQPAETSKKTPKTKKPVKKEDKKLRDKMKIRSIFSIRNQLIVGFMVPVIFVVIVGVFSYVKSAEGLNSSYEDSTRKAIDMAINYLDLGFKSIESDSLQILVDQRLEHYVAGDYLSDPATANDVYTNNQNMISVKQTSNDFIDTLHIISNEKVKMITTYDKMRNGFYEKFLTSDEGKALRATEDGICWIGSHPLVDEELMLTYDQYGISYIRDFFNQKGCIVVDVKSERILNILQGLKLSDDSIGAFITTDGRELSVGVDPEAPINTQEFYQRCLNSEDPASAQYVNYEGKQYLFMYGKSEVTGAVVCTLVPRSTVVSNANQIKNITLILVILACTVAIGVGMWISLGFSSSIKKILRKLELISRGDLTAKIEVKKKNEFGMLADNIMETISNMRGLIEKVEGISNTVHASAEEVKQSSIAMSDYSTDIYKALDEIDNGVSQQAEDSQNCLSQMDKLSGKIKEVNNYVNTMEGSADKTKDMIRQGIETMHGLVDKTESSTQITSQVKKDILELEHQSALIENFVSIINEIAGQTNLLSLNASIEAARAGDAGRGFTVVVEEIKKLANASLNAANEIQKIVDKIKIQTLNTVSNAKEAQNIVGMQADMVNQTISVFNTMNGVVEQLLIDLKQVGEQVEETNSQREGTLEAIESISAVAAQTAASSNAVTNTISTQLEYVEKLKDASIEMEGKTTELDEAVHKFQI